MARGNGRMTIFEDDRDYRSFLSVFGEVMQDFEIEVWNYCLMPNHYHATVQTTLPNLSVAMKRLNATYAQRWNRRHERVGHMFQGRYKGQIVQREGYALELCRYVPRNPVRARLVASAEDWPWSSYGAIIGSNPIPPFLNVTYTLRQFGDDEQSVLQARFKAFVLGDVDHGIEERLRSSERIIGDRVFKLALTGTHRGMPSLESRADPDPRTTFRTTGSDPHLPLGAAPVAPTGTAPSAASSAPV
jgi:putative transposase